MWRYVGFDTIPSQFGEAGRQSLGNLSDRRVNDRILLPFLQSMLAMKNILRHAAVPWNLAWEQAPEGGGPLGRMAENPKQKTRGQCRIMRKY